ncbi:BYPASS-related protein [Tanacetum coccineum]
MLRIRQNAVKKQRQNAMKKFLCQRFFPPKRNQGKMQFDYDSEDMELDEEARYTTDDELVMSEHEEIDLAHAVNTQSFKELSSKEDLDEWLKVEMEKHMRAVKNVLVIIDKFEFPCDFVVTDKPENLGEMIILGRPFLETIHAQIDVFQEEISIGISEDRIKFDVNRNPRQSNVTIEKVYMANTSKEEESFNPLEIGNDLFSYESPACFQFEQDTRNYDTIDPQNETARQTNPLLDKRGLTKRWQVCKPVQVFYDDGSGEDCGMWPTCDPNSSFCDGYKDSEKVNKECLDNWTPSTTVAEKYPYKTNCPTPISLDEWDTRCNITYTGSTSNQNIPNNDPTPFSLDHSELGEKANISESLKLQPFRPRPCDYSFDEWLKVKIGHTNIYNSDREIMFNEWILDSFDVEEEFAKEIGNPYSRRFNEYKQVFDNEVEQLSNKYTLRIGKKGYVMDDI